MSEANLAVIDWEIEVDDLITEADLPLINFFQSKQSRLLVEPLYSSWQFLDAETGHPRRFLAAANVGVFYSLNSPPIVPDMFLSLDVELHENIHEKKHRSYFVWEFGKVPEVAVEIVSNTEGGELGKKLNRYAQMDVAYYVVFDPLRYLSEDILRLYERGFWKRYRLREDFVLAEVGLSLQVLHGEYENYTADWLRWCDGAGNLIPTGAERAQNAESETARLQAELEKLRGQTNSD